MESAPLVLAQTYARKASKADSPTAAVDGHDQAAGQFAKAAKDTSNSEAFRTLKLLEQHHKKLSQIVQFRSKHPKTQEAPILNAAEIKTASQNAANTRPADVQPPEKHGSLAEAHQSSTAHRPQREVSSSIASNLATARGIPTNRQRRSGQVSSPTLNQQNAEGKIVSPPRRSRLVDPPSRASHDTNLSEKGYVPSNTALKALNVQRSPSKEAEQQSPTAKPDEPFNRFYSTFETLFSKLSAPLAFAGLPLNPDSETAAPATLPSTSPPSIPPPILPPTRPKPKTRATASPEYSRLFSPAALRALHEDAGTTGLNTAESFYVVPVTGGTLPYASILARHPVSQHQRQNSAGEDEFSDEFVDARETPGQSPEISRKLRKSNMVGTAGIKTASGKTLEELELENNGLRGMCDELSRRLWQFEVSSQMSHGALHQSIRAGMKCSPAASDAGGAAGDKAELDSRVKAVEKEMQSLKRENEKLKGVVGKYRERWERLKVGAKQRRESTTAIDKVGMEDGD